MSDESSPIWGRETFLRLVCRALWGAWLGLGLEFLLVVVLSRPQLTSSWELQNGTLGLLPAWLAVATLGGFGGFVLALGLASTTERWGRRVVVLALSLFGGLVGWGVGGGRHLASAPAQLGFASFVALVAGGVTWLIYPRLRVLGLAQRWRAAVVLGLILGGAGLWLANRLVLVRLYPAFHLGLTVLQLGSFGLAAALNERPVRRSAALGTVAMLLLALVFLPGASKRARGFDNFRWVMSNGSPTLALGVELAARFAPPPPLDEGALDQTLGARREHADGLDFRGRSVLLVTVDALRADHMGAYGYKRPTTPQFDALARQGAVFDAAYAATPHTSYSLTSLMTGKYMRPLLQQNAGADSDTWADLLRTYGYQTAAFYPPAVFFIDSDRFAGFRDRNFGFEYAKVEFAEGDKRVGQVAAYLKKSPHGPEKPLFLWVHLFGPHEPYETTGADFGSRDIDRYDSEIQGADATLGRVVELFRQKDPKGVILVSADHGEEFGDHGGRYHGTSVYDEQVRVPLLIVGPGVPAGKRVAEPVQTIDLLPTVLSGLAVPTPPRIRGRDLLPLLGPPVAPTGAATAPHSPLAEGRALSETDDYSLLAEGKLRLICARKVGACQLFDTSVDPGQTKDLSHERAEPAARLRQSLRQLVESHGRYEAEGLRSEGKGWPSAILRGIAGDAEASGELAALLDDADPKIRQKSAELLFRLADSSRASALRLALSREEDPQARRYLALALTRAGQGAPLVREMLVEDSAPFRRLAALALAEQGDTAGEAILIEWWSDEKQPLDFEQARELLGAFVRIKSKKAVPALLARLGDVRLRAPIATALAQIDEEDARPALARALATERYVSARLPLGRALWALGAKDELVLPLTHFLGVPDPLEGGLALALQAGVLDRMGGPSQLGLERLTQLSDSGVQVEVTVPYREKGTATRVVLLVVSSDGEAGTLELGRGQALQARREGEQTFRRLPVIDGEQALRLEVPSSTEPVQLAQTVPDSWHFRPGHRVSLQVFADRHCKVLGLVVVPARDELPPPPPEPWEKPATVEP